MPWSHSSEPQVRRFGGDTGHLFGCPTDRGRRLLPVGVPAPLLWPPWTWDAASRLISRVKVICRHIEATWQLWWTNGRVGWEGVSSPDINQVAPSSRAAASCLPQFGGRLKDLPVMLQQNPEKSWEILVRIILTKAQVDVEMKRISFEWGFRAVRSGLTTVCIVMLIILDLFAYWALPIHSSLLQWYCWLRWCTTMSPFLACGARQFNSNYHFLHRSLHSVLTWRLGPGAAVKMRSFWIQCWWLISAGWGWMPTCSLFQPTLRSCLMPNAQCKMSHLPSTIQSFPLGACAIKCDLLWMNIIGVQPQRLLYVMIPTASAWAQNNLRIQSNLWSTWLSSPENVAILWITATINFKAVSSQSTLVAAQL